MICEGDFKIPENQRHISELGVISFLLAEGPDRPYAASGLFSVCPPEAFSHEKFRIIAEAMHYLSSSGQEVGLVSVASRLKDTEKLVGIGGSVMLAELAMSSGIIGETGLIFEGERIAAAWRKDKAHPELVRIMRLMQQTTTDIDVVYSELRSVLSSLEGQEKKSESLQNQLDEYEAGLDSPERMARPTPTPWKSVNSILRGGILPGELAVLAARPSVGKSAIALNMAYSTSCSGISSMVFSLEMSKQQLFDRIVSNVANIDLGRFREGLSSGERKRAKDAIANIREKSLVIFDDTGITVSEIQRRVRIYQRKMDVGLVVVDYLQLVTPEDRKNPREQQVAQMSRDLKIMAKGLLVPVILLAQLNRKSEEGGRTPMLSDLRESGAIEQDADIVIFLHQARQAWHPDEPVQVIIAKGRNSGVGRSNLIFRRKFQRFEDSSQAEYEQALCAEKEEVNQWNTGQDLI